MVNFLGRTDSKETHDAQSLRNAVTTVRNLLAPAIRLAGDPDDPKSTGAMQAAGVKHLEIYFIQSLQRAQKELSRWGGACEAAWTKLLIEQGMGTGKHAAKHTAKKPAKKAAKKKKR
jgi:hypothetical protein